MRNCSVLGPSHPTDLFVCSFSVSRGVLNGERVAVKEYSDETCMLYDPQECRKEIALLSVLRHPRLMGCIGASTKDPKRILLIMEFMPNNLRTFVLSENNRRIASLTFI